jgi:ParB/RepB/Spo0J family partition protein
MAKAANAPSAVMPTLTKGNIKSALGQEGISRSNQLIMVAPSLLRVIPGFNPRIHELSSYQTDMETLKSSIRSEGYQMDKPIAAYVAKDDAGQDALFIIDGHRRFEAVQALIQEGFEIASIPVVLKPAETDIVKLTVATVRENIGRKLTFFEHTIIVRRLLKHGKSREQIAELLGVTEQAVQDWFELIEAPKKIRDLVKMERIVGTEALRILRKHTPKKKGKKEITKEDLDKAGEAAIKEIEGMIANAEKRKGPGARATRKDSGDAPIKRKQVEKDEGGDGDELPIGEVTATKKPKAGRNRLINAVSWQAAAGDEFPLADIRNFKNLFGDTDWFREDDDRPHIGIALEDVQFIGYIVRPRKTDAPEQKEVAPGEPESDVEPDEPDELDELEPTADERQEELADL